MVVATNSIWDSASYQVGAVREVAETAKKQLGDIPAQSKPSPMIPSNVDASSKYLTRLKAEAAVLDRREGGTCHGTMGMGRMGHYGMSHSIYDP